MQCCPHVFLMTTHTHEIQLPRLFGCICDNALIGKTGWGSYNAVAEPTAHVKKVHDTQWRVQRGGILLLYDLHQGAERGCIVADQSQCTSTPPALQAHPSSGEVQGFEV